jgi:copper chaperone
MNRTELNVEGMSCASCVRHVDEALRQLDGVRRVEVRLREGKVFVQHEATLAASDFVVALREAGYESSPAP